MQVIVDFCQQFLFVSIFSFFVSFLMYSENDDVIEEIPSMPGVFRFGINQLLNHLIPLVSNGLESVLLFGVLEKLPKVS